MNTTIFPRALPPEKLRALMEYLERVRQAIPDLPVPNKQEEPFLKPEVLEEAFLDIVTYIRNLRLAYDLRFFFGPSSAFEEHDRIASYLLYLALKWKGLRTADNKEKTIWKRTLRKITEGRGHSAYTAFFDAFQELNSFNGRPHIGILTVLEHEYQSVVRRLDEIVYATDERSYGFAILDRPDPGTDLKEVHAKNRELGWTVGKLGKADVLVVCSGVAGKEAAKDAITKASDIFGNPREGWIVVGVCAGTNESWGIGTILVSRELILDVQRSKSKWFETSEIPPSNLLGDVLASHQCRSLYCGVPRSNPYSLRVSGPENIKVAGVHFACTNEVINEIDDREALRDRVWQKYRIRQCGIEMEGPGVASFGATPVVIAKAVCDYADDRKKNWESRWKNRFQLYAAETAADYICERLRVLDPKGEPHVPAAH